MNVKMNKFSNKDIPAQENEARNYLITNVCNYLFYNHFPNNQNIRARIQ